jgi:hypothetical protein
VENRPDLWGKKFQFQALQVLDDANFDEYIRWPLSRKGRSRPSRAPRTLCGDHYSEELINS